MKKRTAKIIDALLDGGLDPKRSQELLARLAGEPQALREYQRQRRILGVAAALPRQSPQRNLAALVLKELERPDLPPKPPVDPPPPGHPPLMLIGSLVAAAAIGAALAYFFWWRHLGDTAASTEPAQPRSEARIEQQISPDPDGKVPRPVDGPAVEELTAPAGDPRSDREDRADKPRRKGPAGAPQTRPPVQPDAGVPAPEIDDYKVVW